MKSVVVGGVLAVVAGLVPALAALLPRADEPVVVFTLPFARPASTVIVEAQGNLILSMAGDRLAVGLSDREGFIGRLYGQGAILVLDAAASGCYRPSTDAGRAI